MAFRATDAFAAERASWAPIAKEPPMKLLDQVRQEPIGRRVVHVDTHRSCDRSDDAHHPFDDMTPDWDSGDLSPRAFL